MAKSLIEVIGEQTRPAQIQYQRQRYNKYRIEAETNGEEAKTFQEWLKEQGIDPAKLGAG